eukprot:gb/GEZN01003673.1/.p1 GENE.gb/GEZN01003673.1/~~gb/GEZN01003673.1/.p1  ORF type:complete len:629 (+),score=109.15 gb/GEZN01003673.1/:94-1980(+)
MSEAWKQKQVKDCVTLSKDTEPELCEMTMGDLDGLGVKDIKELGFSAPSTVKIFKWITQQQTNTNTNGARTEPESAKPEPAKKPEAAKQPSKEQPQSKQAEKPPATTTTAPAEVQESAQKRQAVSGDQGEAKVKAVRHTNSTKQARKSIVEAVGFKRERSASQAETATAPVDLEEPMELRGLVSNKESGTLIGKRGANITRIRKESKTQINILHHELPPGYQGPEPEDRILRVKGSVGATIKCLQMIASLLSLGNLSDPDLGANDENTTCSMKLLIHQSLAGGLIGRGGSVVQSLMKQSKCRVVLSSEVLPNSTEKMVVLTGSLGSVHRALALVLPKLGEIARTRQTGLPVVLYNPAFPISGNNNRAGGKGLLSQENDGRWPQEDPGWRGGGGPLLGQPSGHQAPVPAGGRPTVRVYLEEQQGWDRQAPPQGYQPQQQQQWPPPLYDQSVAVAEPYGAPRAASNVYGGYTQPPQPMYAPPPTETYGGNRLDGYIAQASAVSSRRVVKVVKGRRGSEDGSGRQRRGRDNRQDEEAATEKMAIPSSRVGAVIGKGGHVIKELKATTGCEIRVERADDASGDQRVVTLTGFPQAIQRAIFLIRQRIDADHSGATGAPGAYQQGGYAQHGYS